MRKLCLLIALITASLYSLAQQRTITGKVLGADGNPLSGASVQIKGTNTGTSTNAEGNFSLVVPSSNAVLVISFTGMVTEEVNVGSETTFNIRLRAAERSLDEVVVVGYGTQQRRTVTSSISKISGSDLAEVPAVSFDRALGGRAAGVNVTLGNGIVNAAPRVRIRGVNSLSLSRDPLVVIDGVPTFGAREGGLSGVANTNPLSDINPADIESVEVLKDGAASAIFGSRAANGVILITTKKGRNGRSAVAYDTYVGMSSAFRKPQLLNAEEFVMISNEKFANANILPQAFMNAEGTNTDWLDVIFRDKAITQSHTLSVNGGNASTTYYLSLNYTGQEGIILTNKSSSYRVRANLEHKANNWVKIGNNITLSRVQDNDQNNGGNSLGGAMTAALRALPNVRVYNPSHPTGYNITPSGLALGADSNKRLIENNYYNIKYVLDKNKLNSEKYRIVSNAFIELTPVRQLSIRSQGSVDYQVGSDFQYWDPLHGDGQGQAGLVLNQNLQRRRLVWQNYLNYTLNFASLHNLVITGGTEIQRDKTNTYFAQGTGIIDPFFGQENILTNTYANQFSGGTQGRFGFLSYFGRLSYDFANKYFVQISLRRDGLSSLAEATRFGTFPGISAGWRIGEENFWRSSTINKIINDIKLRGSYAVVGNSFAGFPYLTTYSAAPYGGTGGIALNQVGNPLLSWETSKKLNVGADFSLLNNRFSFTIDYFRNDNDDLVFAEPTPVSIGVPGNSITRNVASMRNAGWELSAGGDVVRKGNLSWNVNFNFTTQQNKVLSLREGVQEQVIPGPNNGTFNILRVGEPINAIYGYRYAGVNSANGNPMWYKADGTLVQYNIVATAAAGYYQVVKPDDPGLGAPSSLTAADRVLIGSPLPTLFGGLTNTFNYKNFSMEVFLRFQGGNEVYNLTAQEALMSQGFVNNGKAILNRWTTAGQKTDVPKLYYGRDNLINLGGQANSRFVEDGDFVRLQNVSFSYQFNKEMLTSLANGHIKNLRVYIQGQNLAIWTRYTGIDPENTTELGIDNNTVPQLRTFTAGLQLGF